MIKGVLLAGAAVLLSHGVNYALAQVGGTSQSPSDLWQMLITHGPLTAVLAFILWRVDSERRQLQKERDSIIERVLTALNDARTAMHDVADASSSTSQSIHALADYVRERRDKGLSHD